MRMRLYCYMHALLQIARLYFQVGVVPCRHTHELLAAAKARSKGILMWHALTDKHSHARP